MEGRVQALPCEIYYLDSIATVLVYLLFVIPCIVYMYEDIGFFRRLGLWKVQWNFIKRGVQRQTLCKLEYPPRGISYRRGLREIIEISDSKLDCPIDLIDACLINAAINGRIEVFYKVSFHSRVPKPFKLQ